MKPTYDEFLSGSTVWYGVHECIRYKLSWHAYEDTYNPEGTWCWYLILNSNQYSADVWNTLRILNTDGSVDYWNFPDIGAHGGWTYCDLEVRYDAEFLTIGCDYGHSWDREYMWPHNKERVKCDALAAISKFVALFPPIKPKGKK